MSVILEKYKPLAKYTSLHLRNTVLPSLLPTVLLFQSQWFALWLMYSWALSRKQWEWIIGVAPIIGEACFRSKLPFTVWELNHQCRNYHQRPVDQQLERNNFWQVESTSEGVVGGSPLIDSFTVFPEQVGVSKKWENREGWWGKKKAKSRLRWPRAATRSLWPAAPLPSKPGLVIIQLAGVNEGWDEMHSRRRLMKYYSNPPIVMIPLLFSFNLILYLYLFVFVFVWNIIWTPNRHDIAASLSPLMAGHSASAQMDWQC